MILITGTFCWLHDGRPSSYKLPSWAGHLICRQSGADKQAVHQEDRQIPHTSFSFKMLTTANLHACTFQVGRRLVDVSLLFQQLGQGCVKCHSPLDGRHIINERIYGLASLLAIKCVTCGKVNNVATGKQHREPGKPGIAPFDVNNKAALGEWTFFAGCISIHEGSKNIPSPN